MSKTNTEKMAPETQTPEMANGMKLVEEFRDDEGEISSAYAITRQEWEKLKK